MCIIHLFKYDVFRQNRISNPQQEEEGDNKKINPISVTNEQRGAREQLTASGLNMLEAEGPLTCSTGLLGQTSRASTAQNSTGLQLEISAASLTDRETPSISVEEVSCIHVLFL